MPDTYDPFDWATSAAGADAPARPSDAEIANGFAAGETVTSAEINWLWAYVGRLAGAATVFTTLEDAVDSLSAGQSAIVHEDDDGSLQPGAAKLRMSTKRVIVSTRAVSDMDSPIRGEVVRQIRTAC